MNGLRQTIQDLKNIGKKYIELTSHRSYLSFFPFRNKDESIYKKLASLKDDISFDALAKLLVDIIHTSPKEITLIEIGNCLLQSRVFPEILSKTEKNQRYIYENIITQWRATELCSPYHSGNEYKAFY